MKPTDFRHIETFCDQGLTVNKLRLSNGLTLLHQFQEGCPVVSYQTWFRVGSRDDGVSKKGQAHLLEHLMFLGTDAFPAGVYDRLVEARGGRVNAATWLDWTYYDVDVPLALFDQVVELEADRLMGLALTHKSFDAEREVVLNERREQVEDDPDGLLLEKLWGLIFGEHPYGAPTIGHTEDIEGMTLASCLDFYQDSYAADRACICISGGIPLDQASARIETLYSHLRPVQRNETRFREQAPYPRLSAHREILSLPLAGERLLIGFAVPGIKDTRLPALDVLNEILLEGDSSILHRRCVSEGELASTVYGDLSMLALGGAYEIGVDLRPGVSAECAEGLITQVLADLAEKPLSNHRLSRACNQLETRTYRHLQTAHQRAGALGFWELTADDFKGAFQLAQRYRQVTPQEIMEVCREFLGPKGQQVVIGRET